MEENLEEQSLHYTDDENHPIDNEENDPFFHEIEEVNNDRNNQQAEESNKPQQSRDNEEKNQPSKEKTRQDDKRRSNELDEEELGEVKEGENAEPQKERKDEEKKDQRDNAPKRPERIERSDRNDRNDRNERSRDYHTRREPEQRLGYRSDKESELVVHFYIKYISSSNSKQDVHKRLIDVLRVYGDIRDISFMKGSSNDTFHLAIGMKYDDNASRVLESDKLKNFLSSVNKRDAPPKLDISRAFQTMKQARKDREAQAQKEREAKEQPREIPKEAPKDQRDQRDQRDQKDQRDTRDQREKEAPRDKGRDDDRQRRVSPRPRSYSKEKDREKERDRRYKDEKRDFDRDRSKERDTRREKSPGKYREQDKEKERRPSPDRRDKKRSDSKSPGRYGDRKREEDRYRDRKPETRREGDKSDSRRDDKPGAKRDIIPETSGRDNKDVIQVESGNAPEKSNAPVRKPDNNLSGNVGQVALDSGKILNLPNKNLINPNLADPAQLALLMTMAQQMGQGDLNFIANLNKQVVQSQQQQAPPPIEYDNYCLLVGIPQELSEKEISTALKNQGFELPTQFEWKEEHGTPYLRAYFKSKSNAMDLIIRDFNVGLSPELPMYPVMVLPWIKDKHVSEMLMFHEVQVEVSLPITLIVLYSIYKQFGEIIDIVCPGGNKYVIVFAKQPNAQRVLNNPTITLSEQNTELVLKNSQVNEPHAVVRKPFQNHIKTSVANLAWLQNMPGNTSGGNVPFNPNQQPNQPKILTTSSNAEPKKLEIKPNTNKYQDQGGQGGYEERKDNRGGDRGGQGYRRPSNYNRQGGGDDRNRSRDGGYQDKRRDNYNRDGGNSGYQNRDGGYQRNRSDNRGQGDSRGPQNRNRNYQNRNQGNQNNYY